ncbi:putative non-LTR retroelement reverse transcriptase [Panicum miliaceum]|uniref:Non-LTR retroelement reverse transcriptase n=1 Tax=Panicum miliaceum TaxID=4540 RepID=A0A3L6PA90_PANMI|nr:putative non-LTR retroelement reverse transcriptase [Panicum miliaceum]
MGPKKFGGLGVLDHLFCRALRLWVGMKPPVNEVDRQLFRTSTTVVLGNGLEAEFWNSWLQGKAPRDIAPNLCGLQMESTLLSLHTKLIFKEFEQKWRENTPLNPRRKHRPIRMRCSASNGSKGPPEHATALAQRQDMHSRHKGPPTSHPAKGEVGWGPGQVG